MTRRSAIRIVDHAKHRPQWRSLVNAVHGAVEDPTRERLDGLAALALKARGMWEIPAPYPRGLIAHPLWSLALAFGRQTAADQRDRIVAPMIAVAGMMDELLSDLGTVTPVIASAPASIVGEAQAQRLPYAED